jgi:hypothetical protein
MTTQTPEPRPPDPGVANPEPQKKNGESVEPDQVIDPRFGVVPAELVALDDPGEEESELPELREVGRILPIGYYDASGKLHRDFELVEWGWEIEEELGELAEHEGDMPMGVYVSEIIGTGLSKLGELDFTRLKRSQRRLVVSRLFYSDAIYIYVHVRIAALGPHIRFERFKCEKCKKPTDFVGDLRTLEVKAYPEGELPRKTVELERPFKYGGKDVSKVDVGPLKWAFMETDDVATLTNPAKFRMATLKHGVVGLEGVDDGVPIVLTREHAKQIGPAGINRLVLEIDELGGGAVMECAGQCAICRHEFRRAIDWTYDNFFGRSSR